MTDQTLKEYIFEQISYSQLRDVDLGGYEFDWLEEDPLTPDSIAWQLNWLTDAANEARRDGYESSAASYLGLRDLLETEIAQYQEQEVAL